MNQRFSAILPIVCLSLLTGLNAITLQPSFAQTSVTAPQPAKLIYHAMGTFDLLKLVKAGDAAALSELEKRYNPQIDQTPKTNSTTVHDPNAPVLGTSKGLGELPAKFKEAPASKPRKLRSYDEIKKEVNELEAKIDASLKKIKAGTYNAADKKETAEIMKRFKEVQAEYKIKKFIDAVDDLKKRTKIVGDTVKIYKEGLAFVWTMEPAKLNALAEKGDAKAQVELAHRYKEGKRGFEKDLIASFEWMFKAANSGYATAQRYTARNYFKGEGVAKDDTKAVYWLHKSAENGSKYAQLQLHEEYGDIFDSTGWNLFPKNSEKAKYWLDKAVAQGFDLAILHKKGQHAGE